MSLQTLAPDALLLQTNLVGAVTDIDESVDSPDGLWLTATSTTAASILRVSFPTPSGTLRTGANLQKFRIWVRKTNFSGVPTATIELWQSGVLTSTPLAATNVTSTTGQLLEGTWDASGVTAANVELRITGTVGGTGGNRATVEVGAVEWAAEDTNVTVTPAVVAGVASIPTPTVQTAISTTATPAVVSGAATVPTPAVAAETRAFPATVQAVASIPTPAVQTGQRANPATVQAVTSIPTPAVQTDQRANPATVQAVTTIPTPAFSSPVTAAPATVQAVASIPTPAVQVGQRANPATVQGAVTIPTPVTAVTSVTQPATVQAAVTIPAPTVKTGAGVSPDTVDAVVSIPAPTVATTTVTTPVRVLGTVTIPVPVVKTPKLIATVVLGTVSIPTPTVRAEILFPPNYYESVFFGSSVTRIRPINSGQTTVGIYRSITSFGVI